MKGFIVFLVLATCIIQTVKSDLEWRIQLLEPQGFRVLAKNAVGIHSVYITGKIWNKPILNYPNEEYEGNLRLQSNDWWAYENLTATLKPEDKTIFAIVAKAQGQVRAEPEDMTFDEYFVPLNTPRYPVWYH